MAIDLTELDADLDEMIADLPAYMTFGSTTWPVVAGEVEQDGLLEMEGLSTGKVVQIVFVLSGSVSNPAEGNLIALARTSGGAAVNHRVLRHMDSPDGIARTLFCDAEEK